MSMPEQTGDLIPKPPIRAAVYHGPTTPDFHARDISTIQDGFLWNITEKGNFTTFDQLLLGHLERVAKTGGNSFTLLDVGNGNAGLYSDFLTNPDSAKASRDFLADHPDFKIKMVGLTDSPSPQNHNSPAPFDIDDSQLDKENKRINEQIEVDNRYWSLSRTQPLSQFFRENNIDKVDLALATESLRYLSVPVFKEVVLTVHNKLTEGGQFVVQGYGGAEPGFSGEWATQYAESEASRKDKTPWKILFRNNIGYLSTVTALTEPQPFETIEEGEAALQKAVGKYKDLGALTDDDIDSLTSELEREMYYLRADPKQQIMARANRFLARGFTRHEKAYVKRMKATKFSLLKSMPLDIKIFGTGIGNSGIPNSFVMTKSMPRPGGQNEQA